MPVLVLAPRFTEDSIALAKAAARADWEVERLSSWRAPQSLRGRDIVLYAEPLFVAAVAAELGAATIEPSVSWLVDLPPRYRLRDVRLTTLSEARSVRGPVFIKPAVDKVFPAGVHAERFTVAAEELLPPATPVFIAEVVAWEVEFRCFVLDGKVRAISPYWRGNRTAQNADGSWPASVEELNGAEGFARSMLDDRSVRVPPTFVLDVGRIPDRGWAVIEANSAWGAGIYGCDPDEVLSVVRRSCLRRGVLSDEDRPWILDREWEDLQSLAKWHRNLTSVTGRASPAHAGRGPL